MLVAARDTLNEYSNSPHLCNLMLLAPSIDLTVND
jgi:hypothetical protein